VLFAFLVMGSFVARQAILKNPQIRTGMRAGRRHCIGEGMPDLVVKIFWEKKPLGRREIDGPARLAVLLGDLAHQRPLLGADRVP
jgi:hypothetical protein